jgi:predicted dehydrogenase
MPPVSAVVIGAGQRGRFTYGSYARAHPERLRVVAVAEPVAERREAMAREHGVAGDAAFDDWRPLLDGPRRADVAFVATADMGHVDPALAAVARGYHVLLEKPIAPTPEDCLRVVEAAETADRVLQISHVLRYTAFYERIHEILSSGEIGRVLTIDMKERVAYWHLAHSYVRGKFRNTAIAAPIILAKCCHDLDIMTWLVGAAARRTASFGSLAHHRPDAAPAGAPGRCTDGCPAQASCPHDAVRFYADPDPRVARMWPWSDVSLDPSREARLRALAAGPYGRCVYRCDNDVPDHQVLAIEFENEVTGTFTLDGHASHELRTIQVGGSRGELRGALQQGWVEVCRHGELAPRRIELPGSAIGHYGGDVGLLDHFTDVVSRGAASEVRASGRVSLESHLIGFAAEQARREGRVVEMDAFRAEIGAAAAAA